jgi:ribose transport system substrate-binding protein
MKNKNSRMLLNIAIILVLVFAIAACGKKSDSGAKESGAAASPTSSVAASSAASQEVTDPVKELELLSQPKDKGPNGEETIDSPILNISDDDLAKLKEMKVTAAISMHYGGNDWSNSISAGAKDELAKLGIEVIAETDANFKPEKQTADIETIMAKKPDILISVPSDTVSMAEPYRKASAAGIKVILFDQPPEGLKPGVDFMTVFAPDEYTNGAITAHQMAKELGSKGNIGIIYHEADLVVTKERFKGFKDTIQQKYPNIKITEEQGIAGPDFAGDANKTASAFLLKDPEMKAIWGVWDVPAEGIMEAARNAGREDLIITTIDLGKNVAIEMAKGGMIKGVGAQVVYDAGAAAAKAAALAVLGKPAPAFMVTKSVATDKSNVLDAWRKVYHSEPPKELVDAAK